MNDYDALAMGIAVVGGGLVLLGIRAAPEPQFSRVGKLTLGVCCVAFAALHFADSDLFKGAPAFASQAEFLKSPQAERYVLIGRFDESWPAALVDEQTAEDGIRFVRQDGTPHEYSGFDGYRLKVVKLRDKAGREPVIVLRSEFKH